ncbi:MAG: sugar ABC transporter permease [Angelakisella sp.]
MKRSQLGEKLTPYMLIAPAMIGILLFVVYPTFRLVYMSFFKINQLNPSKNRFVGLDNFTKMFKTAEFQKAVVNTGYYSLYMIIIVLGFSLLFAVWLGSKSSKMNSFTQATAFMPHIISMVSVGMIFTQMMSPSFGIFNAALQAMHMQPLQWLQSSDTALASVIFTSSWKSIGYYTLILIAALQSIPSSIYEAADLDNAGKVRTFCKITLPMISPQIFFVLIVLTIGSFKVFETIRVMTAGGPNNATTSLVYYIYRKVFLDFDVGRAAAGGVVLLAMVGVMTVLYFVGLSKKVHYQ